MIRGMDALNRFFDRRVVITLRRATDRQAKIRESLAGLDYELFFGVDGRDIDLADLERSGLYSDALARKAVRARRSLRPGEIGCLLSHRAVYEKMLADGWHRALVLEDDAVPFPSALAQVGAALAQLPPSWELVYLGYEHGEVATARDRAKQVTYLLLAWLRLIHWTPREVLGLHARPYSKNLRRAGKHHTCHAYGISSSGARKLLAMQTPSAFAADDLLLTACIGGRLEAFVTEPKCFGQESWTGLTKSYTAE
jgi:glycosyl transferase family 25